MRVFVLLPAFNEEGAISGLLSRLEEVGRTSGIDIFPVVVDDGSTDRTVERAEGRAEVVRHPRNLGLGAALRTGLSLFLDRGGEGDILVTMDADGTHDPRQIPEMVRLIKEGLDIVVASRFVKGARERGVPPSRRLLSLGASLLYRLLLPIPGVKDYTCGYRAFRGDLLKRAGEGVLPKRRGFEATTEVLLSLRPLKPRCAEVPLLLDYSAKAGRSKMRVLRTVKAHLSLILSFLLGGERKTSR